MSAPTAPRIVRFTASRDQACGSPWDCGDVKAGERCGYIGGTAGPTPYCGPCVDRVDAGEPLDAAPAAPNMPADIPAAPQSNEPAACECVHRADGFRDRGDGVYVHAGCGRATAQAAAAAKARTVDVVEAGQPDAPAAEVGDIGTVTKLPAPREPADPDTRATGSDEPADPLRILVTGSRDWTDRGAVEAALREAAGTARDVVLVHGGAKGADTIAGEFADAQGWTVEPHPADWQGEGKAAGPARNARMVAAGADVCVAFPIGASPGTRDCIAKAERAGIPVRIVEAPAVEPADRPAVPSTAQLVADEVDAWIAGGSTAVEALDRGEQHLVDTATATRQAPAAQPVPDTPTAAVEPGSVEHSPTDDGSRIPLPDLSMWTADAVNYGANPETVAADLVEAVRHGILAGDLRSRQREIGPSEVGHPCSRALAYRLAGVEHTGVQPVPWRQRIGTLVHADNDVHLDLDNTRRGVRWLTNIRVSVGELYPGREITGTLDVFDVHTGTVIDEKVPGATAMRTYGPGKRESEQYRRQVQLYGRGVQRAGYTPAWVAVLRLSPARELSQYVYKFERYDEQVAVDALTRAGGIARMVDQLGARAAAVLPPTDHHCSRCPWFRPGSTELATGCPGAPGAAAPTSRASVDDLVA